MPVNVDSSAVCPSGTSYGSSFYGGSRSARIWFGRPGRVFSGSRIGSYVWRVLKVAATSAGPCSSTIRTGRLLGRLGSGSTGCQPARCRSKRTPATFYEKGAVSRRNLRSLVPGRRKRFSLLSAAQQTEHGIGSRGGIFSGSWVNRPNGRAMLAGLYPLHDAGTIFSFRCRFSLNNAVAVSLP